MPHGTDRSVLCGIASMNPKQSDWKGGISTQIGIDEIKVNRDRSDIIPDDVRELADSMRELGLLTAITLDSTYTLIAGLHRLEAAKLLGWKSIECIVLDLSGLQAELAEIDENIIRRNIHSLDYGDLLLRRKQIYEALHPETRHGGDRKSEKIKFAKCNLDSPVKSFVQDTADKMGVDPSTVSRQLQTARNLTSAAKEILRAADMTVTKKAALQLSRLPPERQKEAATMLAEGTIQNMDEYFEPREPDGEEQDEEEQDVDRDCGPPANPVIIPMPLPEEGRHFANFEESVADLKNMDKDARITPNAFLVGITFAVERYLSAMDTYCQEQYQAVFADLDEKQMEYLRGQIKRAADASEKMYQKVERKRNRNNETEEKV